MEKKTYAGMKAGAVTGFLFPLLSLLVFITYGNAVFEFLVRYFITALAKNGLLLSRDFMILIIVFGSILLGLLLAGLGAALGIMFVKIMANLPFRSTYANAVFCSLVLFTLYSLRYLSRSPFVFDPSYSFVFMIDALIFASLLNHWTKT